MAAVELRLNSVSLDSDEETSDNPGVSVPVDDVSVLVDEVPVPVPMLVPEDKEAPRKKLSLMEVETTRERAWRNALQECGVMVRKAEDGRFTKDGFIRVLSEMELLRKLFDLFDHERKNVLNQEIWLEFLKQRLAEEHLPIDFAEVIESVAYAVCGDDDVNYDRFCQIFKTRGVLNKLFRLVDQDQNGVVTANQVMEFLNTLTSVRSRVGLTKENVQWLEKVFRETVGEKQEIQLRDFTKIVNSKNPFFTERVFEIFDRDNSGSISLQEFIDAMNQFAGQSPEDKIRFLFRVYDIDGDGLIQANELEDVIRACMEENSMDFSDEQIADLTLAMIEDAYPDSEHHDAITYEALKAQLEKHEGLQLNLSISIDRWLVPPKPKSKNIPFFRKIVALKPYQMSYPYIKNNYVYVYFLLFYLAVNLGLFVSRAVEFRNSNYYVIFARAGGQCLNFNCVFILVMMLRQSITFLRAHGFSNFLPLDQHIYFHKMSGLLICFFTLVHGVTHLINIHEYIVPDTEGVNSYNYTYEEWLFTSKPRTFGLIRGVAYPTGVALVIILAIMVICSHPFVRRGGSFEIFYFTHLLYIPFWLVLILHGPNFWKWFIAPGIMFLVERILRFSKTHTGHGKSYISLGVLLPSKVTHLVIKRSQYFDFHPGDYIFVNIPAIAKYEWHPFTISSAPEQDDAIWLHVRAVGEWTNRLYDYFEELHNPGFPQLAEADSKWKRLQMSIQKSLHQNEERAISIGKKSVNFHPSTSESTQGIVNQSYSSDDSGAVSSSPNEFSDKPEGQKSSSETDITSESLVSPKKSSMIWSAEKSRYMLMRQKKYPLSKSVSMPDVQSRMKKRERLLAIRNLNRSESEKSFDEGQLRHAQAKSVTPRSAYLTPQNRSVVKSFRYMWHKPTIIALKTPSVDSRLGDTPSGAGASFYTARDVEEGRLSDITLSDSVDLNDVDLSVGKPLEIYIDGPYGAPSSHIFRAQHAVLIATGIGVTPFASILQSIMHRYWKARHTCPRCNLTWAGEVPQSVMHLRKVDFFWINRDQRSFEWFVNLLSQLEIEQAELGFAMERFLDMHMYITSALQKNDMKAVGLQLALELLHRKEKRDLITGLKTRTTAGRPNWNKIFQQLSDQKKGKVTVFYCGPPALARILRVKCDDFGFRFRKEIF